MKKSFIVLGFISAIVAVVLSVTHLFHLAIAPIIIAFLSGIIIVFLSKKERTRTKTIQYIFLLVIISLSLTVYKSVFLTIEPDNNEKIELQEEKNDDESKKNIKDTETNVD